MKLQNLMNVYHVSTFIIGLLVGWGLTLVFHEHAAIPRLGTADTPAAMTSVNLMVDYGNGTVKTWNTVSWHEVLSIAGLLEEVAAAKEITLTTKDTSKNQQAIEAIDGFSNNANENIRWQYWINNIYEPKVANQYYLKPGDMVMWKLVKEQGQ